MRGGDAASVLQDDRAVAAKTSVACGVRLDGADNEWNITRVRSQRVDVAPGRGDETRAENQIHRRISANRHFGRHDKVGALFHQLAVGVQDFIRVAGKIPDRRVDLCDAGVQAS